MPHSWQPATGIPSLNCLVRTSRTNLRPVIEASQNIVRGRGTGQPLRRPFCTICGSLWKLKGRPMLSAHKCLRNLVAEGGFVPQSLVDSVQLTDSTMVRNAKKGYKGEFFILFSFSSLVLSCQTRTASRMNKRGRQSQEPPNLRHRLRPKRMPPRPRAPLIS
jgi:hypothetical protein